MKSAVGADRRGDEVEMAVDLRWALDTRNPSQSWRDGLSPMAGSDPERLRMLSAFERGQV